jgi:dTDP-4-dehydrorhamnose 3,5-epimerase
MRIETLEIKGLALIHPTVFEDSRGYFFESYNKDSFVKSGITEEFVQSNQSLSESGVLRGLHFQIPPHAQSKLVRVIQGAVLDVVVDIREGSPSYGQHYSVILNAQNKLQLYIPEGFAHGFLTLEDQTIFSYKCGAFYNKSAEQGIRWNDSDLAIDWGIENPILSDKDKQNQFFKEFVTPFKVY